MVSLRAFNSDNASSNPVEVYSLYEKFVFEHIDKEAGIGKFLKLPLSPFAISQNAKVGKIYFTHLSLQVSSAVARFLYTPAPDHAASYPARSRAPGFRASAPGSRSCSP